MIPKLDRPTVNAYAEPTATHHFAPQCPTPEHDGSPILPPSELTPQQRIAVAALVSGRTFSSAAIQAGVDRATLYRWRQQPAFTKAVNDLSREALEATTTRARNLMLKATRTLAEGLTTRDRFAWAIRMINSKRLWELGLIVPADLVDEAAASRAEAELAEMPTRVE